MDGDERSELRGTCLEGRYQVGAPIGVGGTGVVFEAKRIADGADVVVKALHPRWARDAGIVRRLRREAEVSAHISHPGVVPILDLGQLPDGSPYLIMRRLFGESLASLLARRGPLPSEQVAVIAQRTAGILHAVHHAGYVHRDIKPEHILLDRGPTDGLEVHLVDFGICISPRAPHEERESERGLVYGTPSYASPEQAGGDPYIDGRADLWGLGATLFEALTGRIPHRDRNVTQLLKRIIRSDAPRVEMIRQDACPLVAAVVDRLLQRDPNRRFANGRSVSRTLAAAVREPFEVEIDLVHTLRVGSADPDRRTTVRDAFIAA